MMRESNYALLVRIALFIQRLVILFFVLRNGSWCG